MPAAPIPPARLPWLAVARGAAVLLAVLSAWAFRAALTEGLASGTATAWTVGLPAFYVAIALATRWRAGLALVVVAGSAGVLLCYALAVLVAIGGSVAMSAEAVSGGRAAVAVLALAGLLHAILAGASLMALLRATRAVQSGREPA